MSGESKLAVVVGSGLGGLADEIRCERSIAFSEIEGVGACTVAGHSGEICEGELEGRRCVLVLGRRHYYEGEPDPMRGVVRWLAERRVTHLLVTSAAGALHGSLRVGDIVVARDLVDRQDRPRAAMSPRPALDPTLVSALERAATGAAIPWQRGTLMCGSGPAYETAAEVGYLRGAGADVATMSAAPEIAAANRLSMPVAVAALVTNLGTGIGGTPLHHGEVLEVGRQAVAGVARLVRQLVLDI